MIQIRDSTAVWGLWGPTHTLGKCVVPRRWTFEALCNHSLLLQAYRAVNGMVKTYNHANKLELKLYLLVSTTAPGN